MKAESCLEGLLAVPLKADWAQRLREAGEARAKALRLPGAKDESWRLTDLSALYGREYLPAAGGSVPVGIDAWRIPGALRIVFVDGRYSEELSDLPESGAVQVSPLGLEDPALHAHFGKGLEEEAFAQLNLRNFEDCAFVAVKGEAEAPIHVLFVSSRREAPAALYARCLVVLGPHARATLVEEYAGEGACFVNALTEIVLGEQSSLRHVRVQRQDDQSVHVGHADAHLAQGSHYDATSLSFGGRLSRHVLQVSHEGEGTDAQLDGLIVADGRQVLDVHTKIDHLVPNCRTVQRQKCISGGSSSAVFSGNIVVHEGARGTETKQESRNLLLSGRAKIDAQPQLEILNDDVSCRHGATVGQIDAEELFYLKSRGLSEDTARQLLIYAFAAEIVERIAVAALAESLKQSLFGRLS